MTGFLKSWTARLVLAIAGLSSIAQTQTDVDLKPLIAPDTSSLKQAIRDNIESGRKALESMIEDPSTPPEKVAQAYGGLAQVYHAHGFRKEALVAYENAAALAPASTRWRYFMGFICAEMGRLEDAVAHYKAVLERDAKDFEALVRLGGVLLDLNRAEEAGPYLQRALDLDPKSAMAQYNMGRVASAAGDYQAAVDHLSKALEAQPEATTIHYPLGLAYRGLGNRDKAREYLSQRGEGSISFPDPRLATLAGIVTTSTLQVVLAMAAQPDSLPIRDFEGYVVGNLAQKRGVISYLEDAMAFAREQRQPPAEKTELARIQYAIGLLHEARGKDEEAGKAFKDTIDLDPNLLEAYVRLGHVHARADEIQAEIDIITRALAHNPNYRDAQLDRAYALIDLGRPQEARKDLERLLSENPDDLETRMALARLLVQSEPETARAHFKDLVDRDLSHTDKAFCFHQLGLIARNQRAFGNAIRQFETAIKLDPEYVDARLDLASTLAVSNRFSDAAVAYQAVIDSDPSNPQAWMGQIAAFIFAADYDAAKRQLEAAHQSLPDNQTISHLLARFYAAVPIPRLRQPKSALQIVETLDGSDTSVRETRAMALAAEGSFDQAAETQESLLSALGPAAPQDTRNRIKANLERYMRDLACCAETTAVTLLPR